MAKQKISNPKHWSPNAISTWTDKSKALWIATENPTRPTFAVASAKEGDDNHSLSRAVRKMCSNSS